MEGWSMARIALGLTFAVLLSAGASIADARVLGFAAAGPNDGTASAIVGVHRERRVLEPGMVVIDSRGRAVGTIMKIHQLKDGKPAVLIDITGTPIRVQTSKLRLTRRGEEAVISLTPSEIRTAAILNTF
jgi:hypothetical protein